jgi:hypothetical protein
MRTYVILLVALLVLAAIRFKDDLFKIDDDSAPITMNDNLLDTYSDLSELFDDALDDALEIEIDDDYSDIKGEVTKQVIDDFFEHPKSNVVLIGYVWFESYEARKYFIDRIAEKRLVLLGFFWTPSSVINDILLHAKEFDSLMLHGINQHTVNLTLVSHRISLIMNAVRIPGPLPPFIDNLLVHLFLTYGPDLDEALGRIADVSGINHIELNTAIHNNHQVDTLVDFFRKVDTQSIELVQNIEFLEFSKFAEALMQNPRVNRFVCTFVHGEGPSDEIYAEYVETMIRWVYGFNGCSPELFYIEVKGKFKERAESTIKDIIQNKKYRGPSEVGMTRADA